MGLSILFSGTIKNVQLIPQLTEEVQDICNELDWSHHVFDDEDFKVICFSPPECEPVFLTFHNSPELASPVTWQFGLPTSPISTKTQFAGMQAHVALLKLLKHLKEKYFAVFELDDEGGYWNMWDKEVLKKQFGRYDFLLNALTETLKDFKSQPGETAESLADRLEKFLEEQQDKFKKDEPEE